MDNINKTLVCITPQTNSRRLINKGFAVACGGELHILHIKLGSSIFENPGDLLEELFDYGKSKGGIVHFLSGENFADSLKDFAKTHEFTDIVLGEPLVMSKEELTGTVLYILPELNVHILSRPEGGQI